MSRTRGAYARLRSRGPVWIDAAVAAALLAAMELQLWSSHAGHRAPAAVGGAILAGAVGLRRRAPLAALVVGVGAVLGQDALGGRLGQHALGTIPAGILVFYGAGASLPGRRALLALAAGEVGLAADVAVSTRSAADLFFDLVILGLLPWAAGRMLRERADRERASREGTERLDAEREQRTRTAAFGERARIARELHDVIAHSVSVMVIHAGGARVVMDSDPDRAEASLLLVERAGRDALVEMRRLLGAADGGSGPPALAPQPNLSELEALVARTRAAGLATELFVEGEPKPVSPAFDLCAYRIVQEALTNAIKHAGPARAVVRLRWTSEALELEISDDGRGPVGGRSVSGHGIAGMLERAALHGGVVRTGTGARGGFAVSACLPLGAEPAR